VPADTDDLPVLLTTGEVAVLAKTGPAAIRVRVHRGQLRPVARSGSGELLFRLEDAMETPINRRLRDRDAHAV